MTAPAAPHVLISGGGIAGPALAYWLNAAGWRTTVVERFASLRDAGQNIDVRGAGREVARRMGIEQTIARHTTGEVGTEFIDADGHSVARLPADRTAVDGATAELEILRGDLARIVHETTLPGTRYLFGDRITKLDDRGDQVRVRFETAGEETFDLVVIAEGLTSRTRALAFPDARMTHLGIYMAYLTVPRTAGDNDWWRWFHAPRRRQVTLRPDSLGTIRATLAFLSTVRGLEDLARPDQSSVLRSTFEGAGWQTPRILNELDTADYYFDAIGQMRLARWSTGRVALLGDSAYCAAPLSGMGSSLALTGAYVLAAELVTAGAHTTAFERYERRMRPYVAKAQKISPAVVRAAYPQTRAGIRALHVGARLAASSPAQRLALADRFSAPPADQITLPDFHPAGRVPAAS